MSMASHTFAKFIYIIIQNIKFEFAENSDIKKSEKWDLHGFISLRFSYRTNYELTLWRILLT